MTLHEAIEKVLEQKGVGLSASDLADEINKNKLYFREDELPLKGGQVSARVNNYPLWFRKEAGLVYLANTRD